jgi:hypothetical protein
MGESDPKLKVSIDELQLESTSLKKDSKTSNHGYNRCNPQFCTWKNDSMQL